MTQALAERPALPKEQIDLIRKTVANGATDTELQLFLYDCQRRGIHPLDKLLHFTKRGGKYTPVTSIDFMRSQAAATGEMAGSDDPTFENELDPESLRALTNKPPRSATVTVYRLTQGQRFPYTATARWSEYCPDNAPMWKRMPHTMLGKCAEALALRKAFPQQLAGLYAREELDQAEKTGYSVEAPQSAATALPADESTARVVPNGGDSGHSLDGAVTLSVRRVDVQDTKNANVKKYLCVLSDGREVSTINPALGTLAQNCCQDGDAVVITTKTTRWGEDLVTLNRLATLAGVDGPEDSGEPLPF